MKHPAFADAPFPGISHQDMLARMMADPEFARAYRRLGPWFWLQRRWLGLLARIRRWVQK